jgi:hypothetical protein
MAASESQMWNPNSGDQDLDIPDERPENHKDMNEKSKHQSKLLSEQQEQLKQIDFLRNQQALNLGYLFKIHQLIN